MKKEVLFTLLRVNDPKMGEMLVGLTDNENKVYVCPLADPDGRQLKQISDVDQILDGFHRALAKVLEEWSHRGNLQ